MGRFDRLFRLILGIVLLYLGLFTLEGVHGNTIGIFVALTSILPFYMAITASCFVFRWFQINSLSKKELKQRQKSLEKNQSI